MKTKFIMFSLVVIGIATEVTISQQAKAVPQKQVLVICTLQDSNGTTISVGNTCSDGNTTCIANPCNI